MADTSFKEGINGNYSGVRLPAAVANFERGGGVSYLMNWRAKKRPFHAIPTLPASEPVTQDPLPPAAAAQAAATAFAAPAATAAAPAVAPAVAQQAAGGGTMADMFGMKARTNNVKGGGSSGQGRLAPLRFF